jgi:hypothetical protein
MGEEALGRLEVKTDAALLVLESLRPTSPDIIIELGCHEEVAYIRLHARAAPDRWAVVSTPGDRWFSLEVNGGLSWNHFEEETQDGDVKGILSHCVESAMVYVREEGVSRSDQIGASSLLLTSRFGDMTLRRSLAADIRRIFRFREWF